MQGNVGFSDSADADLYELMFFKGCFTVFSIQTVDLIRSGSSLIIKHFINLQLFFRAFDMKADLLDATVLCI